MLAELFALVAQPSVIAGLLLVFLSGLVRGFAGFGAGLVYIPLAAALFGPKVAAATILLFDFPIAIVMTALALPKANIRQVLPLSLGGAAMTPVGFLALSVISPLTIRWGMSITTLIAVALIASGWRFRGRITDLHGILVGGFSGFMNGLAQIGGPPVVLFWLSQDTDPVILRASILFYFLIGSCVTLVTYFIGGMFTREVILLTILMLPIFSASMALGSLMFGKTSVTTYRRIAYSIIALSAISGLPLWSYLHG